MIVKSSYRLHELSINKALIKTFKREEFTFLEIVKDGFDTIIQIKK